MPRLRRHSAPDRPDPELRTGLTVPTSSLSATFSTRASPVPVDLLTLLGARVTLVAPPDAAALSVETELRDLVQL